MKRVFAIPTINGKLCMHFGHCEQFALITTEEKEITEVRCVVPPAHEPGSHPKFLAEKGVHAIIAGGMGVKAQELFAQNRIDVIIGIGEDLPENLVKRYLDNQLTGGMNLCDH